ncbi:hypothetical protein [Ramlibacter sp. 2FC]|uniref:hypothetical protein n=1 Tax=Ramlibacter sp. 2FC TaxID=2502188 RepID=UPI0010F6953E|nr:hypothetical protein [Ramlibacter sp. 2FC]
MPPYAALLAMPLALWTPDSMAQPSRAELAGLSVEQLKRAYLECEHRAGRMLLDLGDSAACSMLHEELRQRGFSGDFRRMLAWWSAQKQQGAEASVPTDPNH